MPCFLPPSLLHRPLARLESEGMIPEAISSGKQYLLPNSDNWQVHHTGDAEDTLVYTSFAMCEDIRTRLPEAALLGKGGKGNKRWQNHPASVSPKGCGTSVGLLKHRLPAPSLPYALWEQAFS